MSGDMINTIQFTYTKSRPEIKTKTLNTLLRKDFTFDMCIALK